MSLYWEPEGCPWAKRRANLQPQSWLIDVEDNRAVSELPEWIDTVTESKQAHEQMQTADVIREVYNLLTKHGDMTQADIVQRLAGIHGKYIVRRVLVQQKDKFWTITVGEKNAHIHKAIPDADVPTPKTVQWGKQ